MDLGLVDKTAFVAGSTRGIGLAIAHGFLREGAQVVVTGRDRQTLDNAVAALAKDFAKERILPIVGDLTDPIAIQSALEQTISAFGRLDAVVANIGSGVAKAGWDLDSEDWQTVLDLNLLGSMALARETLRHLTERGSGTLTFISSIAGQEAINAPVTYSAAKAALLSAVKSLSRLVGARGVRVNAVAPGNVLFPGGSWEKKLAERGELIEKFIQTDVPLQRFGHPDEIADAVVFLASARATFISGACLVVDGGQTRSL